jgi:hypothetical protein
MQDAFRKLMNWLPFLFGIGFIAPLVAQLLALAGHSAPFGLPAIVLGLAVGGAWGLYAVWRGRWF